MAEEAEAEEEPADEKPARRRMVSQATEEAADDDKPRRMKERKLSRPVVAQAEEVSDEDETRPAGGRVVGRHRSTAKDEAPAPRRGKSRYAEEE